MAEYIVVCSIIGIALIFVIKTVHQTFAGKNKCCGCAESFCSSDCSSKK